MSNQTFNKGDVCYVLDIAWSNHNIPTEQRIIKAVVVKKGSKYITAVYSKDYDAYQKKECYCRYLERKFEKDSLLEHSEYSSNYRLFRTYEDALNSEKAKNLISAIRFELSKSSAEAIPVDRLDEAYRILFGKDYDTGKGIS